TPLRSRPPRPTLLPYTTLFRSEAIAELEPDVILAPGSGVTAEQYEQLDDIAPTVAYPEQPWTIEWDDQITTIGKALGREEESEGLVDDIKEQLSDAKRDEYK